MMIQIKELQKLFATEEVETTELVVPVVSGEVLALRVVWAWFAVTSVVALVEGGVAELLA